MYLNLSQGETFAAKGRQCLLKNTYKAHESKERHCDSEIFEFRKLTNILTQKRPHPIAEPVQCILNPHKYCR
jgi:hypothetical protein